METCHVCGTRLTDGARFCASCGAPAGSEETRYAPDFASEETRVAAPARPPRPADASPTPPDSARTFRRGPAVKRRGADDLHGRPDAPLRQGRLRAGCPGGVPARRAAGVADLGAGALLRLDPARARAAALAGLQAPEA